MKNKIEGKYIFYYRNGHLCRFNVEKLNRPKTSNARNAEKRIKTKENIEYPGGVKEITSKIRKNKKTGRLYIDQESQGSQEAIEAKVLARALGEDIYVKHEPRIITKEMENISYPDYETKSGKFWDLKTQKAFTDNAIRKSVKEKARQIRKNPGGIIINIGKNNVSVDKIRSLVQDGMRDTWVKDYKTIIKNDKRIIAVYKKK